MQRVCSEHSEIAGLGAEAANLIVGEYLRDESGLLRLPMLRGTEQLVGPESSGRVDVWLRAFDQASGPWRGSVG